MFNVQQKATYAILGAMIGDALGATLEFTNGARAKELLLKHSNFSKGLIGSGPFDLLPGQFTDDTEMGLAIMSIIVKYGYYDQKLVSSVYRSWYLSNPPDIGYTTRNAVSNPSLKNMLRATQIYNTKSLSNGFLMRLFGLVGLYYNKKLEELIDSIRKDVSITHSHPETQHIAIIYGIMLHKAINGYNSDEIYYWGKNHCGKSPLITTIYYAVANKQNKFEYDNKTFHVSQIATKNIGFVGYSIWMLLYSLVNYNSYKTAILKVVEHGGDTDTNACIVGAVFGALYPTTIPEKWIDSLINCSAKDRYKYYPIANPQIWIKWLPIYIN